MHTGFSSMVNSINLQGYPRDNSPVSRAHYEQWRRAVVFDALQGVRYGQSFCNHFDITDNILFYERDPEWSDVYIRQNYVV